MNNSTRRRSRARRPNGEGAIYKRADGRWEAKISLGDVRRCVYGKTQAEARAKRDELIKKYQGGYLSSEAATPVRDWLNKCIKIRSISLRESSIDKLERYVAYVNPYIGHMRIGDVRIEHLEAMYIKLAKTPSNPRGLGKSSLSHIRSFLRNSFKRAVKYRLIPFSPAELADIPRLQEKKISRALTSEQLRTLLKLAQGTRFELIVSLGALTGLRRGEILGLKWSDINLLERTICISESYTMVRGRPSVSVPKTEASARIFAIPRQVYALLLKHKENSNSQYLFVTDSGKRLRPDNLARDWRSFLRKHGLPPCRIHDLRHTANTTMRRAKIDAKTRTGILGHSSVEFNSDEYDHVQAEDLTRAAGQLSDYIDSLMDDPLAN